MFVKEGSNCSSERQQQHQSKHISSISLNSVINSAFSIPNEQVNQNKKLNSFQNKMQIKEMHYEYEKTRTNTNSQMQHVSFLEPFAQVINVRSYKKYNKLPSLNDGSNSPRKSRQNYYDFGQDNVICKCIII